MVEKLADIELDSIKLTSTNPRTLDRQTSDTEENVETGLGLVHVRVQGDRSKTAILTYHDIGLNDITCFHGFFSYDDMHDILNHFCVYHVNAPGQEEGAMPLGLGATDGSHPDVFQYPSVDQLADMILPVMQHFQIRRFIGVGVGAGANILTRFALCHPKAVDSLFLINPTCQKAGWTEWAYQKMNVFYLKKGTMTEFTKNYLLWHWFGDKTLEDNHDLAHVFKEAANKVNPVNLCYFIESFIRRSDLGIVREHDTAKKHEVRTLHCNVMLVTGDNSPHVDSTVDMNSKLDPMETTWMKIADCGGMPLEEQPEKVCDAFRLFLQGMGYVPSLSQCKIVEKRASSHHR